MTWKLTLAVVAGIVVGILWEGFARGLRGGPQAELNRQRQAWIAEALRKAETAEGSEDVNWDDLVSQGPDA